MTVCRLYRLGIATTVASLVVAVAGVVGLRVWAESECDLGEGW